VLGLELREKFSVGGFELIRMDIANEDLVEGYPRKPARQVLRAVIGDRPEHPAGGFADKHNFAAVRQEINPATQDLRDIRKILDIHSPIMADSIGKSSAAEIQILYFYMGRVFKINFGF